MRRPKVSRLAVAVGSGLTPGVGSGKPFFVFVTWRKPLTAPVATL
jgi:hypothetical protein